MPGAVVLSLATIVKFTRWPELLPTPVRVIVWRTSSKATELIFVEWKSV